jgi:hypothetical protein
MRIDKRFIFRAFLLIALALRTEMGWAVTSPCDVNHDGVVDNADVQLEVNASLGLAPCTVDLDGNGRCDVIDVQRIVVAALGGVCRAVAGGLGLLTASPNPNFFQDSTGKVVPLFGSQTWNDEQDQDNSAGTTAIDWCCDSNSYVQFLKSFGHNVTILWHKDLPSFCGWGAGGTWTLNSSTGFPWPRPGPGNASDGRPQFDLNSFNQAFFDRLRQRVIDLNNNGIYAIVELFDGLGLTSYRCSQDGYPFTSGNNINSISDGGGAGSMTMSAPNAITAIQDAYVKKMIDTINDQANVVWEISEEASSSSTWWEGHMIGLIHAYEKGGTFESVTYPGKPLQHPVGYPTLGGGSDSTLYNSNADWVAPIASLSPTTSCGSGTPACKVNINDSDHSYGYGNFLNGSSLNLRAATNYVWQNAVNGNGVMFMDPYAIYWPTNSRNLCTGAVNGVCTGRDTKWDPLRANLGYAVTWLQKLDLAKVRAQPSLSSTNYCLAQTPSVGAEYLVYAPSGGSFTVNLSATTATLNVQWLNPATGATTSGGTVVGGSSSRSFTPPFSGDAVLYLVDSAGHA